MAGMTLCGQCKRSIAAALHYCPHCGFDQDSAVPGEEAPASERDGTPPPAADPLPADPPPAGPSAVVAQRRCVTPDCGQAVPAGAAECPYCGAPASDEGASGTGATPAPCALLVLPGGASISVTAEGVHLGRDPDFSGHAGTLAGYSNVSRRHALISVAGGRLSVSDLDSTNGTFVNGTRLAAYRTYPLNDGDELRMGATCALRVAVETATPGEPAGGGSCG